MKLKLMAGAAVVAFLAASSAHAEWYAGFDVGYNNPHVTNLESSDTIAQGSTATAVGAAGSAGTNFVPGSASKLDYRFISDENIAGFARLGFRASPNVRMELEVGERRSDLEAFGGPVGSGPVSMGINASAGNTPGARFNLGEVNNVRGEFSELSIMANALYDFAPDSVINPYLGLGVGMVR